MKKLAMVISAFIATAGSPLLADTGSNYDDNTYGQDDVMNQSSDCARLREEEQYFATQIMDANNKSMFCSQFTAEQRQRAMQMLGQLDSSGTKMNADQAVMRVRSMSSPGAKTQTRTGGACPVRE